MMTEDPGFHFPPDVFNAIVDALPLLTRGKKEGLVFFRGCGVAQDLLRTMDARIDADPKYNKYHTTRDTLEILNSRGDVALAARREFIKRVSEFDDFYSCYPDNQLKAQGAVAAVFQLVNKKDSFTRMRQSRDEEQRKHREAMDLQYRERQAKRASYEDVRSDLFRLFGGTDPHRRGKALEGDLNRLFQVFDILVREAFVVTSGEGDGTIEQIDGAIELDSRPYLVEMKWWDKPMGRTEVSPHLVSVYGRADAGGIFISASGFHPSAISEYRTALSQRTVVLVELREIVSLLTDEASLADLLRSKVREATLTKQPLTFPLESSK
jgi:restriction system protein